MKIWYSIFLFIFLSYYSFAQIELNGVELRIDGYDAGGYGINGFTVLGKGTIDFSEKAGLSWGAQCLVGVKSTTSKKLSLGLFFSQSLFEYQALDLNTPSMEFFDIFFDIKKYDVGLAIHGQHIWNKEEKVSVGIGLMLAPVRTINLVENTKIIGELSDPALRTIDPNRWRDLNIWTSLEVPINFKINNSNSISLTGFVRTKVLGDNVPYRLNPSRDINFGLGLSYLVLIKQD